MSFNKGKTPFVTECYCIFHICSCLLVKIRLPLSIAFDENKQFQTQAELSKSTILFYQLLEMKYRALIYKVQTLSRGVATPCVDVDNKVPQLHATKS